MKAVEPLRYEAAAVREALLEVRNQAKDPIIRIEAESLAEEAFHCAQWSGMMC